jgi:4-hydroxybenzoate polyprenyltransferase
VISDHDASDGNTSTCRAGFRMVIDLLRVGQWVKNGFIFVPIVFSGELFLERVFIRGSVVFAAFCLASSAAYIVNDLFDLKADQVHHEKRRRPLAGGGFPRGSAVVLAVLLAFAGTLAGFLVSTAAGGVLLSYLALNIIYCLSLKKVFLLDVFAIALGFVARVLAGAVVTSVPPTKWLLLMTFFLALFLALGKRRQELVALEEKSSSHREVFNRYSVKTLDNLLASVTAMIIVTFSIFTLSDHVITRFHTENLAYTIPVVVYGLFRYLHLIHDTGQGGDPSYLLLTDRPLMLSVFSWVAACVLIIYGRPG